MLQSRPREAPYFRKNPHAVLCVCVYIYIYIYIYVCIERERERPCKRWSFPELQPISELLLVFVT